MCNTIIRLCKCKDLWISLNSATGILWVLKYDIEKCIAGHLECILEIPETLMSDEKAVTDKQFQSLKGQLFLWLFKN